MKYALEINKLTKWYSKKSCAISEISFNVEYGKFHAYIGPNGSGKTTTIKCIVGLYKKFSGEILINGINNRNISSLEHIGYVPEIENFYTNESVLDFLIKYTSIYGISKNEIFKRVDHYLNLFNVEKIKNKKISSLSSGQSKIVNIIQAVIHNPKILILDEPTVNLDPDMRIIFYNLLLSLKSKGTTIFISTHNLDEIEKYTDYITMIREGKIIYSDIFDKDNLLKFYTELAQRGQSKNV